MTGPAIQAQGITKTYCSGSVDVRALEATSLELKRGEILFLMGPSGSGKTTLLSILGCILRPSAGRLLIHGKDVTSLDERKLPDVRLASLGFIFQGFNLFPTLTAEENVELMLNLKGVAGGEAKTRAQRLLDQVGLGSKAKEF